MRRSCNFILVCISIALISPTLLIFSSDSAVSDETVEGQHITTDTTWYLSNSPYYIEGDVYVDYGYTLTIEAGVTVLFNGFYGIFVDGNLTAVGEPDYKITFTSNYTTPYPEAWNRIHINSTGSANIKHSEISYAQYGLFLNQSKESNIHSNIITDNYEGVHLFYSSDNIIMNNEIVDNTRGIYLYFSDSNEIRYNRIFSSQNDGITILYSSYNEMSNNNLSQSGGYGIRLTSSPDNRVFHNNLNNNVNQAYDNDGNNDWDDGYPSGGNYWSDYTGEDVNKSVNQDVPGSDGIGDVPYTDITGSGAIDNFPLMNQTPDKAPILINLISPSNRSVIKAGTIIYLEINIPDRLYVNYTKQGTDNVSIDPDPPDYKINTTGWSDGYLRIYIFVVDINGLLNSSWFSFTFDSVKPTIQLNSPLNNSMLNAGDIIDFTISDPHLNFVSHYINDTPQGSLPFPHDIDTQFWQDDVHTIKIIAQDTAGNFNSTLYSFTIDSTPPVIWLSFPKNGSYFRPGVPINFSISDENMFFANYSLNDGPNQSFVNEYFINTTLYEDGNFSVLVFAEDELGNFESKFYEFTIDTINPMVILNSPVNNSLIRGGVEINFSVIEASPFAFRYSSSSQGTEIPLHFPYNINTSKWINNITYSLYMNVTDYAGNFNLSWYNFTIDSIEPKLDLVSPLNNSIFPAGTEIIFDISDLNLLSANYSIDGGEPQNFTTRTIIDTTYWQDETFEILVSAGDLAGHNVFRSFIFHIDSIQPGVVSSSPGDGDKGVPVDTSIRIQFSEEMNPDSLVDSVSISPSVNFSLSLSLDNLTLVISPYHNLTNATKYTVVINSSAMDLGGNTLQGEYIFTFTTGPEKEEDSTWLILLSVLAILIGLILLAWLMHDRKKRISETEEVEEEEDEFDVEKEPLGEEDVETGLFEEEEAAETGEEAEKELEEEWDEKEVSDEGVEEASDQEAAGQDWEGEEAESELEAVTGPEVLKEEHEGKIEVTAPGEEGIETTSKKPKISPKKIRIRVIRKSK